MKIQAPTRLKEVASIQRADFSDQQIQVIRTRLLPALAPMTQEYYFNNMTWIQNWMLEKYSKKPGSVRPNVPRYKYGEVSSLGEKLTAALMMIRDVDEVLHAIADPSAPASRAAKLGMFLQENKKFHSLYKINKVSMENWLKRIFVLTREMQPAIMTEKGQNVLATLRSTDFKLLAKSWPWICQEMDRTFNELIKKHGLTVFSPLTKDSNKSFDKDPKGAEKIWKALQKILPTWKAEVENSKYPGGSPYTTYSVTSPDGLTRLIPDRMYLGGDYAIIPQYKIQVNEGYWTSWARTGVDGGEVEFPDGTPLEHAVETLLAKINKSRDKTLERNAGGVMYDFGPFKRKMLPAEYQSVVTQLKKNGRWETGPGGFGTYYVFRTGGKGLPASTVLSTDVGSNVVYHTEERD